MTHDFALKLVQTETPEQISDRIVELYDTIKEQVVTIEEQAANIEQLSYDSWYKPPSGNNDLEVPTIGDGWWRIPGSETYTNLPQSATTDTQPIITLQFTDRREAIRALRVDDYAIALETIRDEIRNKLKHEDLGDEAYDILDDLWMHYHVATEDLPEEL